MKHLVVKMNPDLGVVNDTYQPLAALLETNKISITAAGEFAKTYFEEGYDIFVLHLPDHSRVAFVKVSPETNVLKMLHLHLNPWRDTDETV